MTYKRLPEAPKKRKPNHDKLFCTDAQIQAVKELVGGLSEPELLAAAQQLREMGVIA